MTSALRRNILFNGFGQATVVCVSFIGVHYLFRGMGADAFGILLFAQAFNVILLSGLDGFSVTTVTEVAALWKSRDSDLQPFLRTLSAVYTLGFALGVLVVLVVSQWFANRWLNRHTIDAADAAALLRIFALGAVTAILRNYLSAILRGVQRMEFGNIIDAITTAAQQLGAVLLISRRGDAYAVAYLFTGCFVLSTVAYASAAALFVGWWSLIPRWDYGTLRSHFGFTVHNIVISLGRTGYLQGDKAVVSKLATLAQFGYYSLASTITMRLMFIAVAISQASLPLLTQLHRRGDHRQFGRLHNELEELQLTIGGVTVAAFALASFPLFSYLLERQAATQLVVPAVLLATGLFLFISTTVATNAALASGRADIVMRGTMLSLVVGIPLEVWLVARFSLVGAAAAWVAANIALAAATVPVTYSECLHARPIPWLTQIARVAILIAVSFVPAWLIVAATNWTLPIFAITWLAAIALYGMLALRTASEPLRAWLLERRIPSLDQTVPAGSK